MLTYRSIRFNTFAKIFKMSKTRLTVIRHGETEWNKKLQMQGHQDSPLTSDGKTQAKLLAETIHHRNFEVLITSDLGRARETSEIINTHLQLKVLEDISLRERAFGLLEGLKREEAREKYPEPW